MTDHNNLTPPPELVQQWLTEHYSALPDLVMVPSDSALPIATQAARWGADAELEACVKWVALQFYGHPTWATELRAARRPKPPSLKEQALSLVPEPGGIAMKRTYSPDQMQIIRRALESLPDGPAVTPARDTLFELPEAVCIDGIELPKGARVLYRESSPVTEQASPAATDVERLGLAQLLEAEADSDDRSGHTIWIDSRELRRAAEILRGDTATQPLTPDPAPTATPGEQYHEGMGDVTWWRFPVEEPPWVGSPNDSDWPGYHTHFTPLPPVPVEPDPAPTADSPVATDEELYRLWRDSRSDLFTNLRAIYNLGRRHGAQDTRLKGGEPAPTVDDRFLLWELMRTEYSKNCDDKISEGYAAELRIVADELERRQMKQVFQDLDDVIAWLRAEADRAENP